MGKSCCHGNQWKSRLPCWYLLFQHRVSPFSKLQQPQAPCLFSGLPVFKRGEGRAFFIYLATFWSSLLSLGLLLTFTGGKGRRECSLIGFFLVALWAGGWPCCWWYSGHRMELHSGSCRLPTQHSLLYFHFLTEPYWIRPLNLFHAAMRTRWAILALRGKASLS